MTQPAPVADIAVESRAGDILLTPIALAAFWTLCYQLVLVTRWPAETVVWCFFAIALASKGAGDGPLALGRVRARPGASLLLGLRLPQMRLDEPAHHPGRGHPDARGLGLLAGEAREEFHVGLVEVQRVSFDRHVHALEGNT